MYVICIECMLILSWISCIRPLKLCPKYLLQILEVQMCCLLWVSAFCCCTFGAFSVWSNSFYCMWCLWSFVRLHLRIICISLICYNIAVDNRCFGIGETLCDLSYLVRLMMLIMILFCPKIFERKNSEITIADMVYGVSKQAYKLEWFNVDIVDICPQL